MCLDHVWTYTYTYSGWVTCGAVKWKEKDKEGRQLLSFWPRSLFRSCCSNSSNKKEPFFLLQSKYHKPRQLRCQGHSVVQTIYSWKQQPSTWPKWESTIIKFKDHALPFLFKCSISVNPPGSQTASKAQRAPILKYTHKVKIINPEKKSMVIVTYLHTFSDKFESVNGLRIRLMDEFQQHVPATTTFDVGYFEGKQQSKVWLVTSDD